MNGRRAKRKDIIAFYNSRDERDPYKRKGDMMPKPWKGGLSDGSDIGRVAYAVWGKLRIETAPIQWCAVPKLPTGAWTNKFEIVWDNLDAKRIATSFQYVIDRWIDKILESEVGIQRILYIPQSGVQHPIKYDIDYITLKYYFSFTIGVETYKKVDFTQNFKAYNAPVAKKAVEAAKNKAMAAKAEQLIGYAPDTLPDRSPVWANTRMTGEYIKDTDKAILVRFRGGNVAIDRWAPTSQIANTLGPANGMYTLVSDGVKGTPSIIEFYVPRWLADKIRNEIYQEYLMSIQAKKQDQALSGLKDRAEKDAREYDRYARAKSDARIEDEVLRQKVEMMRNQPPSPKNYIKEALDKVWAIDPMKRAIDDLKMYPEVYNTFDNLDFGDDDYDDEPPRKRKEAKKKSPEVVIKGKRKLNFD